MVIVYNIEKLIFHYTVNLNLSLNIHVNMNNVTCVVYGKLISKQLLIFLDY
jgi:hypothetical protein